MATVHTPDIKSCAPFVYAYLMKNSTHFTQSAAVCRVLHGEEHSLEHSLKFLPACSARVHGEPVSNLFMSSQYSLYGGIGVVSQRCAWEWLKANDEERKDRRALKGTPNE
jgi:hypothetical protein